MSSGQPSNDRPSSLEIVCIRHGTTAWTLSHRHTGRTDIPLEEQGEIEALELAGHLRRDAIGRVFTSPLERARRTAELAGLLPAEPVEALVEWDYGAYEGLTTAEIVAERPGWDLFVDGCPDGEDAAAVGARADRILAELRESHAEVVAVVSHGHFLRVLAARWIGLPPATGRLFGLDTASIGLLTTEHDRPIIGSWNLTSRAARLFP